MLICPACNTPANANFNASRCNIHCSNCNSISKVTREELLKEGNEIFLHSSKAYMRFNTGDYDDAYKEGRYVIKNSDHDVTPLLFDTVLMGIRCKTEDFTTFPMTEKTVSILHNYYDALLKLMVNCPEVISETPEFLELQNKINNLKTYACEYREKRVSYINLRFILPSIFCGLGTILLLTSIVLGVIGNMAFILSILLSIGAFYSAYALGFIGKTKALARLKKIDPNVTSPFIYFKE